MSHLSRMAKINCGLSAMLALLMMVGCHRGRSVKSAADVNVVLQKHGYLLEAENTETVNSRLGKPEPRTVLSVRKSGKMWKIYLSKDGDIDVDPGSPEIAELLR